MNRLSFLDALFLYLETPETPMHVASATIFKPASPQDDLFIRFREHVASRLDLLPSYRRRLEATPLGIDHPAWVVEDKLDLDYHIRHAALPKPGGMKELRALIAQLHAAPLDRSRPLWEYHFIEGLEGGAFAVYAKVHHSAMDGLAGMATLGVTFDFAPGAEHEKPLARIVPPDVEPSDFIELTSTAVGDFIRQGWRAITGLPGVARALARAAPHFGRDARFLFRYVKEMPRTPLNTSISGHRVYATSSLPLPEVRALAKSRGVTINDVVLALSAGALRRYLAGRAALPEKALTAAVPVSVRPYGDAKLNNQVFFALSRLPTNVAEPLPRLVAAQVAGQEAKNLFSDLRDLLTTDISILGAPLVVTGLTKLLAGAHASNHVRPFYNVIVSNVPGPRRTMYCVGAPAIHYFPLSIPHHGCALNITVQSYLDQLEFGLVACSETVPDAQRIADTIAEDFAAMRRADAELGSQGGIETIAVTPRPAPLSAHEPITLGEAQVEPPAEDVEKTSALTQQIDALGEAVEALLRRVGEAHAQAATPRNRAASKEIAEDAPARPKRARTGEARKPASRGNDPRAAAPTQSEE
jgi:diacylglycerol O-acyltransferase / wax synthase